MFRILGFVIGSLTSIAIILLVTGIPTFHLEDPEIDQQRFDAAVEKLLARKEDAERVIEQVTATSVQNAAADQDDIDSMQASTPANDQSLLPPVTQVVAPENAAVAQPGSEFQPDVGTPELVDSTRWYSFWNPFRSQIAANGFVSQLEKVTGLDYRIVKVKSGVYEVAFAYDNDTERREKLAQISAATGLDLPDS